MKNFKIISGGQTGVDLGTLIAAKEAGVKTGGFMPAYFTNHDGKNPEFANMYGMEETVSTAYPPRTALNVKNSDATIRIAGDFNSAGEVLTLKMIQQYKKPYFDVPILDENIKPSNVAQWIVDNKFNIINVAGNSEKTCKGIGKFATAFISEVIEELKKVKYGQ